jgi:hypothetical protein
VGGNDSGKGICPFWRGKRKSHIYVIETYGIAKVERTTFE